MNRIGWKPFGVFTAIAMLASTFCIPLSAQEDEYCGTNLPAPPLSPPPPLFNAGGMYVPAGSNISPAVINALMLFIEFPDDPSASTIWPKLTTPSSIMSDIIDISDTNRSGKKYNVTTYYRSMSFNALHVIGHPVYRRTRYSLEQYQDTNGIPLGVAQAAGHPEDTGRANGFWYNVRYWATRHVLQDLDSTWDFGEFDRWTVAGAYNTTLGPDSTVDMIFACWRNDGSRVQMVIDPFTHDTTYPIVQDASFRDNAGRRFAGIADLGGCGTLYVDSLRRKIQFGFPAFCPGGAGVTVLSLTQYPNMMDVPWHEFGHYLFGGGNHQYIGGMWSVMGYRPISSSMNSYERMKLGWIPTSNAIGTNAVQLELKDFATTGIAYRFDVGTDKRFYIENHQRLTDTFITSLPVDRPWYDANDVKSYDRVDQTTDGALGLYILQQNGPSGSESNLRVVCADGRWNWSQVTCPNGVVKAPWDTRTTGYQKLGVWQRGIVNRISGNTDREFSGRWWQCTTPDTLQPYQAIWAWKDPETGQIINDGKSRDLGDGKDRWTLSENNVFSPWSNPSSRSLSSTTTVGLEVVSEENHSVYVKFYTTTPESGSPSKPMGLQGSADCLGANLIWNQNNEPDVLPSGHYEVWRRTKNNNTTSDWAEVTTVIGSDTTWSGTPVCGVPNTLVQYKIRVVDEANKNSLFSDPTSWFNDLIDCKRVSPSGDEERIQDNHIYLTSYPSPSHGTAHLSYSLNRQEDIEIHIYNALGQVVQTLSILDNTPGKQELNIDLATYKPGVYAVVLEQRGQRAYCKMVVE